MDIKRIERNGERMKITVQGLLLEYFRSPQPNQRKHDNNNNQSDIDPKLHEAEAITVKFMADIEELLVQLYHVYLPFYLAKRRISEEIHEVSHESDPRWRDSRLDAEFVFYVRHHDRVRDGPFAFFFTDMV